MRALWSLPKAAPALLRHLAGYLELAGWDLGQAGRHLAANLIALVIAGACLFFALLMGCIGVLALTWDGPHRLGAILWMGGGFLTVAVLALLYVASQARTRPPFLASVRQEWRQDAVILEKILGDEERR